MWSGKRGRWWEKRNGESSLSFPQFPPVIFSCSCFPDYLFGDRCLQPPIPRKSDWQVITWPTSSQSFRVLGIRRSRWRNRGERSSCTHFIEHFASIKVRKIFAIEILQYRVYCKAVDWTNLSLFCRRSAQWYSYLIPHFSHPQINDIHSFRNRVNSADEILLLYPFNVSFASVLRFSARSGVTLVELTAACVQHKNSLVA